LKTGGAPELMQRWQRTDYDHDIVFTTGYNIFGTIRYADRDFVRALYDVDYACRILGAPIDTGLSPDDTLECLLWHEAVEKVIIDADNPIDLYDEHDSPGGFGAHEYATVAEHKKVRQKGGDPARYERGLAGIVKFCMHKQLLKVPADYACAPLLDDPDENEKQVKRLQELKIADAFKISKEKVDYASADRNSGTRCISCKHWQNQTSGHGLSTCAKVDGLVRDRRWCQRYEVRDLRRTRVPLKVVGGTLVVAVEINDVVTLDFILDSGAADVSVPSDVASVLFRKNALKKSDFIGKQIYMLADGSSSPSDTFIIRSLRIGDKQVQNVRGSIGPVASEPLLGQAFLQHFQSWSIDNSKWELLLEYP